MSGLSLTATMDTAGLNRALPLAVLAGTRTLDEQCVTSMGWILINAQKATPKASIAQMDSELQVITTPVLSTRGARAGLPLRSGRTNIAMSNRGSNVAGKNLTVAEMIVISQLHNPGISQTSGRPNYNLLTGNRFALGLPGTRGVAAFLSWVIQKAVNMVKSRHSSIAFIKSGYTAAIRKCFASSLFQHSKKYRSAGSVLRDQSNRLNTIGADKLGDLSINGGGTGHIQVRGENNVGETGGNSIMDEKHRRALIQESAPYLQAAINREQANLTERGELGLRMTDALKPVQALLS